MNKNANNYIFDIYDERELARLQLQDDLFNEVLDLFPQQFSPKNESRILDVACGPGGWALRAAQFSEASVTGVDLSPQMITYARAQAEMRELDVQFRIMDIRKIPWDFPDSFFDLINLRFITGFAPVSSFNSLYQECWRVLRPGGVIRNTEVVYPSMPTSSIANELANLTFKAMWKSGLLFSPHSLAVGPMVEQILRNIGFKNMTRVPYIIDLSHNAPMHKPMKETLSMSAQLLKPYIVGMGLCTPEKLAELHRGWNEEWNKESFCCHYHVSSISGTKNT